MDNVYTIYRFSLTFFCKFNLNLLLKNLFFHKRKKRFFEERMKTLTANHWDDNC